MSKIPTAEGGDGIEYRVFRQEYAMSCTAACLRMVMNQTTGKLYDGMLARVHISLAAHSQAPGAVKKPPQDLDWDKGGAEPIHLAKALQGLGIQCEATQEPAQFATFLQRATPKTPCVIGVRRHDDNAWHAVVVVNQTADNYIVLDPAIDIQLMAKDKIDAEEADYTPNRQYWGYDSNERYGRYDAGWSSWGTIKFVMSTHA